MKFVISNLFYGMAVFVCTDTIPPPPPRKQLDIVRRTLGTAVAHWLRCCATNRKVAGSIPDGVIGIFH